MLACGSAYFAFSALCAYDVTIFWSWKDCMVWRHCFCFSICLHHCVNRLYLRDIYSRYWRSRRKLVIETRNIMTFQSCCLRCFNYDFMENSWKFVLKHLLNFDLGEAVLCPIRVLCRFSGLSHSEWSPKVILYFSTTKGDKHNYDRIFWVGRMPANVQ